MSQIVPKPVELSDRDFRRRKRRSRHRRHHRRRFRRRLLIGLVIAVPALGILAALAVIPALGARDHLEKGRDDLTKAQSALLKGDLEQATERFTNAENEFRQAAATGDNPLLRIPAFVPLLGRTPDAIRTISDVGVRLSDSGGELTRQIAALPEGIDSLAPTDGRIPVRILQGLAPAMARARTAFEQANLEAGSIATTLVPHQVVEAGDLLRSKLQQVLPAVRAAAGILRALPTFAGVDSPQHYFLGPENATELRGTGGLITTYSILTMDDGAISVEDFTDIKKLPELAVDDAPWPSEELKTIYGAFNSAGDARNANATLDGPSAATLLTGLWNQTHPEPIDGVILVDVQALRYLMEATGPIDVQGVPGRLTPKNVVPFVSSEAYDLIKSDTERKDFVGVVGQAVFDEFLKHASGDKALRALVRAAADGHILMNASDPQVDEALRSAGVSGALGPLDGGDFLGLAVNNTAGNKIDYYMQRQVGADVRLNADGSTTSTVTVGFRNDAPTDAQPGYVFGPFLGKDLRGLDLQAGEAFQRTSLYCAPGCSLDSATRDGEPYTVSTYSEHGFPLLIGVQRIPKQSTYDTSYELRTEDAWSGSTGLGTYRLTVRSQPTLNPTTATISIHVPDGTTIAYASEPLDVKDGVATWTGELSDVTVFEVRFQKGLLGRVWSGIDDFLSKPVIRL